MLVSSEPTPVPPQRPSSGRTVQVRRSRPASAIRPATAATPRPRNLKAGAAPSDTVSFTSQMQSGSRSRSPRHPTATARPTAPSQPTTVRRDGTGLLVPHSVLGPTEDFEASLRGLLPPPDLAPASPEPTPRSGAGLDSLASSPQRPPARSSGFSRSITGHPPTTRELEAQRKEHRESETPTQVAERRKLEAQ